MSSNLTPIDISKMPDLLDLVEEVEATKKPRELMLDNKTAAIPAHSHVSSSLDVNGTIYERFDYPCWANAGRIVSKAGTMLR